MLASVSASTSERADRRAPHQGHFVWPSESFCNSSKHDEQQITLHPQLPPTDLTGARAMHRQIPQETARASSSETTHLRRYSGGLGVSVTRSESVSKDALSATHCAAASVAASSRIAFEDASELETSHRSEYAKGIDWTTLSLTLLRSASATYLVPEDQIAALSLCVCESTVSASVSRASGAATFACLSRAGRTRVWTSLDETDESLDETGTNDQIERHCDLYDHNRIKETDPYVGVAATIPADDGNSHTRPDS